MLIEPEPKQIIVWLFSYAFGTYPAAEHEQWPETLRESVGGERSGVTLKKYETQRGSQTFQAVGNLKQVASLVDGSSNVIPSCLTGLDADSHNPCSSLHLRGAPFHMTVPAPIFAGSIMLCTSTSSPGSRIAAFIGPARHSKESINASSTPPSHERGGEQGWVSWVWTVLRKDNCCC